VTNRRQFLLGTTSAIAATLFLPIPELKAAPLFDQRNGFNMNAPNVEANYCYIDHFRHFGLTVIGTNWSATAKGFNQVMGATEWPADPIARTTTFRISALVPDYANFAGPYTIDWKGDGQVFLADINTGVTINSRTNASISGRGSQIFRSTSTSAAGGSVTFTINDPSPGKPTLFRVDMLSDIFNNGRYLNNVRMYRAADATRFALGKLFRTAYLQTIADLNPSAIRFLNWIGWTNPMARAEHLGDPTKSSYGSWTVSPPYGQTAGSGNAYTLTSAAGMPATMQHGEVVTCRMNRAIVREGGAVITAITNANPGKVTTSSPHGFNTGDIIWHGLADGVMPKLRAFPVTITVIDSLNYTIGIDTTTYGAFSHGRQSPFPFAAQYVSLNVGGRGAFPVMFRTQCTMIASGANITGGQIPQISIGDYKTFYFDKSLGGITNGTTGDWVTGVDGTNSGGCWMMTIDSGNANSAETNWPIEHIVAFTNEVNEISVAAGRCVSGCWITMPGRGLITSNSVNFDPDYTSGSNMPVALTGKVINGANGFNGLQFNAYFWAELGNELWNLGSFPQSYMTTRGYQRYAGGTFGTTVDFYPLRSVITMKAIKAAFPSAKINYVLGGFIVGGTKPGGPNYTLCKGSTNYFADPVNTWGTAPIVDHDCLVVAPYTDCNATYVGSGRFATDSALYATGVPANMTSAMNSLVTNGYIRPDNSGIGLQLGNYYTAGTGVMPDLAAFMNGQGKLIASYEGGLEANTAVGSVLDGVGGPSHTITSADSLFLIASYRSSQWNTAQNAFWDGMASQAGHAAPSILLPMNNSPDTLASNMRWAYATPDNYLGGVEGANLPAGAVWAGMGTRNRALGCGG
jgi:hypothetical protein